MIISGGTVTAASSEASGESDGICADGTVIIRGGNVTAFGEIAGIAAENLTVSKTNLKSFLTGDDAAGAQASDPDDYPDNPTKYVAIAYQTPSSGGGGGAAAASNPVNLPASGAASHGKVTSSAASAKAGDKVTLTVPPDQGYEVKDVVVKDAKGNTVPVTENADGTWSFTMPDMAVTITPEYTEIGTPVDPGTPAGDVSDRFKDVKRTAWYHDAVQWAVDKGLMNGVSDTLFAPNDSATRAMVVTMVWRLAGEPAANSPAPFTDVKDGAWYAGAVAWAAETGAVNGTSETTFSPNEPVTREQLAALLYRYAQAQGKGFEGAWMFLLDYPDADQVSDWAGEAMHWMVMHGVITGMGDGTLAPKDNATRAQIAAMFMRFAAEMEQ